MLTYLDVDWNEDILLNDGQWDLLSQACLDFIFADCKI